MDPIKVDFSKKGGKGVKDVIIPPEKSVLKIIISIIVMLITAGIAYYFMLPALNFKSTDLYIYIAVVLGSFVACLALTSGVLTKPEYVPYVKKRAIVPIIILAVFLVVLGVGYVVSAPLFRAKSYSTILDINTDDKAVDEIIQIDSISDFDKIPMIDKISSDRLANNTLGDLAAVNLESQFEVDEAYSTQINYKGSPYRVYSLKYGDIFKWIKQTGDGAPGYVLVNMNTQVADFVQTDSGIRYSTAEHFNKYVLRVVRFKFPTYLIGNISFEIDDTGHPYWICQHLDKTVGLLGGDDVVGIILVDAYTGECKEYAFDEIVAGTTADGNDIAWIDQVFDDNLLVQQYNYLGKYSNGFINYYIGQEGVKLATQGSSYLADGSDVYLYTGVTSVTSDSSILGFAIINQRTKEAYFYNVSGATEAKAQGSAEAQLSDKGWKATFPLLINLQNSQGTSEPTYFMALKADDSTVKGYSMVSVKQYTDVATSPADDKPNLKSCLQSYINILASRTTPVVLDVDMSGNTQSDIQTPETPETPEVDVKNITGVITDIRTVVIGGTSYFYIKLAGADTYYYIAASLANNAAIINVGDSVTIAFGASSEKIIPASDIKLATVTAPAETTAAETQGTTAAAE